jgi:endogenous inhibitor of DNA gyrase (YacG/DUF329 family)
VSNVVLRCAYCGAVWKLSNSVDPLMNLQPESNETEVATRVAAHHYRHGWKRTAVPCSSCQREVAVSDKPAATMQPHSKSLGVTISVVRSRWHMRCTTPCDAQPTQQPITVSRCIRPHLSRVGGGTSAFGRENGSKHPPFCAQIRSAGHRLKFQKTSAYSP